MSKSDVERMHGESRFHDLQYSELEAMFDAEWKKHFDSKWRTLNTYQIEKILKEKGLIDLLELYKEMDRAMELRNSSRRPLGLR